MQDLLIWITLHKGQAAMRENTTVSVAENSRVMLKGNAEHKCKGRELASKRCSINGR